MLGIAEHGARSLIDFVIATLHPLWIECNVSRLASVTGT